MPWSPDLASALDSSSRASLLRLGLHPSFELQIGGAVFRQAIVRGPGCEFTVGPASIRRVALDEGHFLASLSLRRVFYGPKELEGEGAVGKDTGGIVVPSARATRVATSSARVIITCSFQRDFTGWIATFKARLSEKGLPRIEELSSSHHCTQTDGALDFGAVDAHEL
eukprot:scaffold94175_cov17-Prasinocladus_malaysianus.AAC.2